MGGKSVTPPFSFQLALKLLTKYLFAYFKSYSYKWQQQLKSDNDGEIRGKF